MSEIDEKTYLARNYVDDMSSGATFNGLDPKFRAVTLNARLSSIKTQVYLNNEILCLDLHEFVRESTLTEEDLAASSINNDLLTREFTDRE